MNNFEIRQYETNSKNLEERILERSGIKDFDRYLNPSKDSLKSPFIYKNMKLGAETFLEALKNDKNIGILVDSDVDGLFSSAICHLFIKNMFPNTNVIIFHHNKSSHGLTENVLPQILKSEVELLLLPDSSSNDHKQHKTLIENGIDFIVIDHHIIEDEGRLKENIIINNQRSDNKDSNSHLSGSGMALKFIEACYNILGFNFPYKEYYDLASIGQVGDMLHVDDEEIRYIVQTGLRNVNNPMLKEIIKQRVKHVYYDRFDFLTGMDVSFYISPLINAVARIGTLEERELLYESVVDTNSKNKYKVKRRRKINGKFKQVELTWDQYEYTFDILQKVKRRQDSISQNIEDNIDEYLATDSGVSIYLLDEIDEGSESLLGLTANKLVGSLNKPVIILRNKDGDWFGSGRGYDDGDLDSLKDWCNDTGQVEFAKGHDNAFGIYIKDENIEKFITESLKIKQTKDKLSKIKFVDHICYDLDKETIKYGHLLRSLMSRDVDIVKFGFKNISFNKEFIRKRGSMLTLWEQGVEFILFGDNGEMYNELNKTLGDRVEVDIIGEPRMQYWNKNGKPQVIISDIKISE